MKKHLPVSPRSTVLNSGMLMGKRFYASCVLLLSVLLCASSPKALAQSPTITITPSNSYCPPVFATLSVTSSSGAGTLTYTWAPATGLSATTGSSVVATPAVTTTYTATVTDTTGATASATTKITVYATPPITGTATVCVGGTTTLANASAGGFWIGGTGTPAIAVVDTFSGVVTGNSAGTATISYIIPAGGCVVTRVVTVTPTPSAITGTATVCTGTTTTLGNTVAGGTWSSSNTAVAIVGSSTGIVTGNTVGTSTISYIISAGCSVTKTVTVSASPGVITGVSAICDGTSATLTDSPAPGTWSSSTPVIATISTTTGIYTGIASGTSTITYTQTSTGCHATKVVTINPAPSAVTGTATVCVGSTTSLGNIATGGTWSSSNLAVATIGSATGVVTGNAAGTSTISYILTTGCATSKVITVNTAPAVITPATATVCVGGTVSLTDVTGSGTWSSSSPAVASVGSASGVVTGNTAGVTTISYTISSGCSATAAVTVSAAPAAILPAAPVVCTGLATTLTDAVGGGTWSSSTTSVATIDSNTGVVTGIAAGMSTITYAIGSCTVTQVVTVNTSPSPITPSTATSICIGSTATLADASGGGTWLSSNTGIATVDNATGIVSGVAADTATISYVNSTTGCYAVKAVTINTVPGSITPAGASVCAGSTTTLTDASAGGTWSSASTGIATVDASTGIVTGVSAGNVLISYTLAGSCAVITTVSVNASPAGLAVTPNSSSVCLGSGADFTVSATGPAVTLLDQNFNSGLTGAVGGTWSIVNTGSASPYNWAITAPSAWTDITIAGDGTNFVGANADLAGSSAHLITNLVSPSFSTVGYSAANLAFNYYCYSSSFYDTNAEIDYSTDGGTTWSILYNYFNTISGNTTWTAGTPNQTIALPAAALNQANVQIRWNYSTTWGFYWVVDNITLSATAPVASSAFTWAGVAGATGLSCTACDSVTITPAVTGANVYSVSATIGTCSASATVTVNATPVPTTITGTGTVCVGGTTTLADTTTGGAWSSSDGTVASIDPISGIVTGMGTGMATITYSTGSCYTTTVVTVNTTPTVAPITGSTLVCVGTTITLSDATTGGVWNVSNGNTTISASGVITGVAAGTDTVVYIYTTACGVATASYVVTVNPFGSAGIITGPSTVCVSSGIMLSDAVVGGIWSSSNGNATVVSSTGLVIGIMPGLDTISYNITGACGLSAATKVIMINSLPSAGTISGADSVCPGSTISLSETVSGGVWAISGGNASISGAGVVTGITAGTATVSYAVTNSCGTITTTATLTVDATPSAASITGLDSVCTGSTITLADATAGGTWSAGNANATVDATGIVTGVSAGTVPITYTITNSCGAATAVQIETVVGPADAGTVSGTSSVCVGSGITLFSSIAGGVWTTTNDNATVTGPGIVTGVTVGIDTIIYTVTNYCSSAAINKIIDINPIPVVTPITGATQQCAGTNITLANATAGGFWTSSNASVASVDLASGVVAGVATGIASISYTVINGFGCPASVSSPDTVSSAPVVPAITGTAGICAGATTTLADTATGGVWSSSDISVATIDASGDVASVAPGTSTISYAVTNGCGTVTATVVVSVNALPVVAAISGTDSVCAGAATTLANSTAGGTWSSSDTTIASVDASGVVTGVAGGIATITYTVTSGAGCSSSVTTTYTVNALPVVPAIAGTTSECLGATTTLSNTTTGGTWSSSDITIATVDAATGIVTGVAGGMTTISYTVTNASGCVTTVATPDTVNVLPVASLVTGTTSMCAGMTTTLADTSAGGTWSSSDITIATVDATGIVTGVSGGTAIISYSISNSCGTISDTATVTINALPDAGVITSSSVATCTGTTITLTESVSGGVWSSSDATIATVDATGIVTGVNSGTVMVTYTVTNASGCISTAVDTLTIISAIPASLSVIPGTGSLCHGSTVYMYVSDTTTTGVTYQWLMNGDIITGATNGSYTADTIGTYSVVISNGICTATLPGTTLTTTPDPIVGFTPPNILYTGSFTTYQWLLDSVVIPGATSSIVNVIGAGTYQVIVTNGGGCIDTSAGYVYTTSGGGTTGVGNTQGNADIKIYPNPASSILHIEAGQKINISVLSIDGKVLMQQKDATDIDINQLAGGVYMLLIYDENNILLHTARFSKAD